MPDDTPPRPAAVPTHRTPASKSSVKAALAALKETPSLKGRSGWIHVPFPRAPEDPFSMKGKDLRGAQHGKVPVAKLLATQDAVKRSKVKGHIKKNGDFHPMPVVACANKRYYILDGHHRATADWFLKKKKMRANVIDVDAGDHA